MFNHKESGMDFFIQSLMKLTSRCAAEPRSYHIAGGIPVEQELAIHA